MKNVFCIGELLIDFVAEKQGSDLAKAHNFTKKAGGAPANVASAIAKLGGKSFFIGCVGKDPFGTFLINTLTEGQVDVSLAQRSDTFTTLAFVSIAEDGERDFVFSRGADKELTHDIRLKNLFKDQIVHFGAATSFLGGSLEEAYSLYLQEAISHNSFICFDPNFRADLWKGTEEIFIQKCLPFVEKSDLCKFSLEEAQLLSKKEDLKEACTFLHQLGTKIITVTLGGEGTYLSTPSIQKIIPSIKVKPVDTTGAGDAFIGCLLKQISLTTNLDALLADSGLLEKMVQDANKAGAITTLNYGAIESLPSQEQINQV
ncbi:fructokinase [Arenibacter algicola]|uniref:Fructokinase n=1 Tax=Arenibacter algicola TaxID=616991 RepID=A0ABY3AFF9_9FLAO|nr:MULTISPECIES: carbohydrate kinase [Arenibacter]GBF18114.1 2-dehydro-3-deoxygluconokinase [Arenibacter sp. NBRC 103722]HCO83907.1 carbohydrate kinase [Arenibacter sp.]|tara:strand:- start:72306 stop:73253 length:948 start_codon:yes stop_codon:yes gene_type:complete